MQRRRVIRSGADCASSHPEKTMSLAELFANNYFIRLLRGRTGNYDLIVSMVGVKLGERLLQIGGGDGLMLAAMGRKTGLTGQVSAVEADAEAAERVRDQATKDGVLSDALAVPSFDQLPFPAESFDIVVIPFPGGDGLPGAREAYRVLRPGGRLSVIARGVSDAISNQLQQQGFKAARLIADRDGYAFYEAIKK
jgi:ubiquinone/menaquinone biosynthesis C-methylase UbiE